MLFDLPDFRGLSAMPVERFARYRALIDSHSSFPTFQTIEKKISPLLDLAAVRWVVVPRSGYAVVPRVLDGDPQLPLAYTDDEVCIFENRAAVPGAFLVHRILLRDTLDDATDQLAKLAAGRAHAGDGELAEVAVLESNLADQRPADLDGPKPAAGESARVVASDAERVVVEAALDSPGFVVLSSTYYPGWQARVDGALTPVFPADVLFRAVYAGAGRHRIVFTFEPERFRLGLALALLALLLSLMWWVERRATCR
jgi:hypothetical protein